MASVTHMASGKAHARAHGWKSRLEPLRAFWMKVNNDWVLQLSSMLAYSFLVSIFPLLLVILAIVGEILGLISPGSLAQFQNSVASALPADIGSRIVDGVIHNLQRQAGPILI